MANGISFSGIGSGIDFDVVRDAIIAGRSRSITRLQGKVSLYNTRIQSLTELNSGLAGLITATGALTDRSLGTGRAATSSDASVATATAADGTALGQYNLQVTRLATNLTQTSRSYNSADAEILAGGATSATFELRKGGSGEGVQITIDSSNNSLEGLRDTVNSANAGVKASIVDVNGDGTGNRLVLTSDETGAAGRVELFETSSTGTQADLNITSANPSDGDFSKLDAQFSINNLSITRSSNTVSNAVEGVTFTLKNTGSAAVSVAQSGEIETKLNSFVFAYNKIQESINAQYKTDEKGRPTGTLVGDSTLRSVQRQMRDAIRTVAGENGGTLENLTQIGVIVNEDGFLELDKDVLNKALKADSENVRSLLYGKTAGDTGIFQQIESIAKGLGDSITGTVQAAITGYETSIETINKSIDNRLEYINRLRESLTRQFAAADAAIGQLNGQGEALAGIIKSLEPRDK